MSGTGESMQPLVALDRVGVRFDTERGTVTALENISLAVRESELLTVIGPSGCGKSTLLRVIADLVMPTSGEAAVAGSTPANARQRKEIGFVFQEHALLPWRSAIANVRLPLEVGKRVSGENDRAPELLELVGLTDRADALPHELSGGMRQRVAIARALITRPRLLLMDEPFGSLDEITRDRLHEELLRIWERTGTTIVFVTHSISEALFLGQRVLVLAAMPGRVLEIVDVDLPDSRALKLRESESFVRQAARLRELLERC